MSLTRSSDRVDDFPSLLDRGLHGDALAIVDASPDDFAGQVLYAAARQAVEAAKPEAALAWLQRAKEAFRSEGKMLASMRTDLGLINVLDDLARTHESIGVAQRLQQNLDRVDVEALDADDRPLHGWLSAAAAENLGASLGLAGRHAQAVQAHQDARARYVECGSELDLARVDANLGVDLIHLGDGAGALAVLETARRTFATQDDSGLVDRCLMYESKALALTGRYGEALDRLTMVLAQPTDVVSDPQASLESAEHAGVGPAALRAELVRASVYESLNLFPEALDACDLLAPQFERRSMLRDLAAVRRLEARAVLGQQGPAAALSLAQECVQLFDLVHLPVRAAAARITLARCLGPEGGSGEIDHALPILAEAGELRGVGEAALVGADLAPNSEARASYVAQAIAAGTLESPETRWRTLWHQSCLTDDPSVQVSLLDHALDTLADLQSGLTADHLRAPFMANRRSPLESRLLAHLDAGDIDLAFALSASHRARALRAAREDGMTAPVLTQTTLLYQTFGERLVCFIARPTTAAHPASTELVELGDVLPEVRDLLVALDAKWRPLADPRLRVHIAALRDAAEDVLCQLHRLVFAEIDARLAPGPITIVPAGCLSAIPFAALFDGTSYLIDRRVVSVSPGVPRHAPAEAGAHAHTLVVGLADDRAPLIHTESTQIAELAGGQLLLGQEATADAVRSASADADIIHLATHSIFRPDNPWLSWLRLADRDVTAAELATWDLSGKTVVLAACSSGRQSSAGQDEMLGLPRAAFAAGAATVIVHQWAVDDIASVGLMSQFHTGLAYRSPAEALRQAQLACRDLHPHPYFWAGAVAAISPLAAPLDQPISPR